MRSESAAGSLPDPFLSLAPPMPRTKPTQRMSCPPPRCGCEVSERAVASHPQLRRELCAVELAHQQRLAGEALSLEDQRALPSAICEVRALVRQLQGDTYGNGLHDDSALAVVLRVATHQMRLAAATATVAAVAGAAASAAAASSLPAAASSSSSSASSDASIPPLLPVSTPAERHAARLPQLEADAATGCGRAISRLERYRQEQAPPSAHQLQRDARVNALDEIAVASDMEQFELELYPSVGSYKPRQLMLAQTAYSALIGPPLRGVANSPISQVFKAARHVAARAKRRRTEERLAEDAETAREERRDMRRQEGKDPEAESSDEEKGKQEEKAHEQEQEEEHEHKAKRQRQQGPDAGCP